MKKTSTAILVSCLVLVTWLAGCVRPAQSLPPTPTLLEGILETIMATPLPAIGMTPEPVASPTPSNLDPLTTATPSAPPLLYAVAFVGAEGLLNMRAEPGMGSAIVQVLGPETVDLEPTGQRQDTDGMLWLEFRREEGSTGWVSALYLTEQVSSEYFCGDERVQSLLDRFVKAVNDQDGPELARLVSPAHGLTIHHNLWNPGVNFSSADVLVNLFGSTFDYNWGLQESSGLEIIGPFKEHILPKLQDVTGQQHQRRCNILLKDLATGPSAGMVAWPVEYAHLNYFALYRQAPLSQELDWRTWAVGIEYYEGRPYLAVLIQFSWEI